jgi:CRISPR/Cas system-associated protein Csx1
MLQSKKTLSRCVYYLLKYEKKKNKGTNRINQLTRQKIKQWDVDLIIKTTGFNGKVVKGKRQRDLMIKLKKEKDARVYRLKSNSHNHWWLHSLDHRTMI